MPDFIAVQCFQCNHYQVSQKRKDSKFVCKLCGAKQSVRKIVAHSHKAADVRKFVQKINLTRGQAEEQFEQLQEPHSGGGLTAVDATAIESEGAFGNGAERACNLQGFDSGVVSACREADHANFSDSGGQLNTSSKWAPYETALRHNEAQCRVDESGEENDTNDGYNQDNQPVFVTALPDGNSRKPRKRKRNISKPDGSLESAKRGSFKGDVNNDVERFGQHAEADMALGAIPNRCGEAQCALPALASRKKTSRSRGSRWNKSIHATPALSPAHDILDFADGLSTTLGGDEVVEEDIAY